jgi:hypothetical protein
MVVVMILANTTPRKVKNFGGFGKCILVLAHQIPYS